MLRTAAILIGLLMLAEVAAAQSVRGVVVDQTGLPLPGVEVQLLDGSTLVRAFVTREDGTFDIDASLRGTTIVASLDGFETTRVDRADAARIVLPLARATDTATVIAPTVAPSPLTTASLGSSLTATTVSRLPSTQLKARESLGLLPSVIRGPDGLLRLGGARVNDTPLLIDGFNVTDPATGTSSINLPFEAVRGIDLLRDPMAVTYGGLLGGLVQLESRPGGDEFTMGVQGFVPRPRFSSPGIGRLEGVFPRVFAGGSHGEGRARHFSAAEWDFERIPVPGVTQGRGPDIVEKSAIVFTRTDFRVNDRNSLVLEGLALASGRDSESLSPRRDDAAAANTRGQDLFLGVTNRFVVDATNVVTVRVGAFDREASLRPRGSAPSFLSPEGWRGNWFTSMTRRASRYSLQTTWERAATIGAKLHELTLGAGFAWRRLRGSVAENSISIENGAGQKVREITVGSPTTFSVSDQPIDLALRDVWHVNDRLQIDAGARLDHSGSHGGTAPSGRVGVRLAFDESDRTVLKAGYGRFVGSLPLLVEAFGRYPTRTDRRFDPTSGAMIDEFRFQPAVTGLRLPRADAFTVSVERQLRPGLDAQVSVTERRSSRLATLDVPGQSSPDLLPLAVTSTGKATYREFQVSVRRTMRDNQQVFFSYVRSAARGELNDFSALFQGFDAPLLQPGGQSRLATDAPHRVLAWGTFNLPGGVVISPVTEWRTGFPYSTLDDRYLYAGSAHDHKFPAFMATDLIIYRNFTVRNRSADLGIQLFNSTNHDNPRDVYPVAGTGRFGEFTNSVGPILRGFMLLKW